MTRGLEETGSSAVDSRGVTRESLVERAAMAYLQASEPEALGELELVFEPAYALLSEPEDEAPAVRWEGGRLKATSPFVETTSSASALFIAFQMVRELIVTPETDLSSRLEEVAAELAEYTGDPSRVEGLTRVLARMRGELELLRQTTRELGDRAEEIAERPAPDLLLVVKEDISEGGRALQYFLREGWEGGSGLFGMPAVQLLGPDSRAELTERLREVEKLPRGTAQAQRMSTAEVEGIGMALFKDLLPKELRRRLWSLGERRGPGVEAPVLYLISNGPGIPWELLKLQEPGGIQAGPFLSEAFALSRWVFDRREVLELPLRSVAAVAPSDSRLPEARSEVAALRQILGAERPVVDVAATYSGVIEALASGRHDGWHFVGHGLAGGETTGSASLQLEVGEKLTANALRARGVGLGRGRPLVFLSTCHGAHGSRTLTRPDGLAAVFLELGAGAFLGAHWAVPGGPARSFAEGFYREFVAGSPLAGAVRTARLQARDAHPGDPTWLAYAAFGHPAARCAR